MRVYWHRLFGLMLAGGSISRRICGNWIPIINILELVKSNAIVIQSCAWYNKTEATFSDVIALVRRHIWHARNSMNSARKLDLTNFQEDFLEMLLDVVCYAA